MLLRLALLPLKYAFRPELNERLEELLGLLGELSDQPGRLGTGRAQQTGALSGHAGYAVGHVLCPTYGLFIQRHAARVRTGR